MAISPGEEEEEAGGREENSFPVQVCVRLLLNRRSLASKVHLDCFHHNISVVTNDIVSVKATKL